MPQLLIHSGGGALDSTSVKPSESINSSNSNETEKTNETTKSAKSAKTSESVTDTENFETNKITQTLIDVSNTNLPTSNRGSINVPESAESREASTDSSTTDDASLTWTRDDFNITPDGKQIGYRKDITVTDHDGKPSGTENVIVPGLNAKGLAKLKKNHHIVIPEGIEVIHECAFTGSATQVGNKHEHIDGETYIEGVTLPQSLKIIEYGAFGWNKIKGTVTIPKSVISIHNGAFVANEIEKVVFEGVIDGTGKEHDTDADPYYLAGVGSVAFQGNKISEIVVKDNLGKYQLYPSNNPQKSDSVFDNQNPGTFTIEVGDEYKRPITITQENSNHTISVIEGFKENGSPVQIESSSYFKKNKEGKYIAVKPGTLEGQCLFYDIINRQFRIIGISHFTYKIVPKAKIYTVTFVNGNNSNYASVQVKEGKSISENSVAGQMMPSAPSKEGYTFVEWNADSTGKDKSKIFTDQTPVKSDMTVYAIYTPKPAPAPIPTPVPKPTPDPAPETDEEQTPAPDSTPITDFVPSHVQEYTKNQDYSFDVKKQDEAPSKMQIHANSAKHLPETGSSVAMAMNSLFASVFAGIFVLVGARKSLRSYSKHARKN
ncbi:hypothetical protein CG396_06005 [Bifidobacteriaceae bacterium N170]|nr:hypothetical protein CG396_06005 [Bifidobacteriaceae bacterium N170]